MSNLNKKEERKIESPLATVQQALDYLQICRATFYKLINEGDLELKKMRNRSFVLRSDLEDFVENLPSI